MTESPTQPSETDILTILHSRGKSTTASASGKRTCILVLGMHRSGTSAVTRVINLLGAALPKEILGPGVGNEAGHWEPRRLVDYHERFLAELGSAWFDWRALDLSLLPVMRRDEIKSEIAAIVEAEYSDASLFVVKDPRICRFAPLFIEAMADRGIQTRFVIPCRNPLEISASLAARNEILFTERSRVYGALVWLRHMLDAEAASRNFPRAIIAYEDLVTDWRQAGSRMVESLGVDWPNSIDDIARSVARFIKPTMRHHVRSREELVHDTALRNWVSDAYAALDVLQSNPASANATEILNRIRGEFDRATPLIDQLIRDADAALARARGQAVAKEAELNSELEALRTQANALEARLEIELARAASKLAEREAELKSELKKTIAEQSQILSDRDQDYSTLAETIADLRKDAHENRALALYLRSELSKPRQLGPMLGTPLLPIAVHQLEAPLGLDSPFKWRMVGNDPWLLFDFATAPLKPGYYELLWDGQEEHEDMLDLKLYVDTGHGFNESSALTVVPRRRGEKRFVLFTLVQGALRLRFDVSNKPGELVIGNFTLRRLGKLRYHVRVAAWLIRTRIRSTQDLSRALRTTVRIVRQEGAISLARHLRAQNNRASVIGDDYDKWIDLYDKITDHDRRMMKQIESSWQTRPLISIIMPTYNTPATLLREAIESVLGQIYDNWELCIADDYSTKPHVRELLDFYERRDPRIKVFYRNQNGHISRASNSALEMAKGEWIALLDHDDVLAPHALFCVVDAIHKKPRIKLLYSDEDKIDLSGRRSDPYFKSDWNPMLFQGHNLISHLGVYEADLMRRIGGFREGFEGSQDYDLALRFIENLDSDQIHHIPQVLYHWRKAPGSTAVDASEKPYAMLAGQRALNEHFKRTGQRAHAELTTFGLRSNYKLPDDLPLVSIIIPTRNALHLTQQCIESVAQLTNYPSYEILVVDNGSDDPACLSYLRQLSDQGIAHVLRDTRPFNYSALNNFAVTHAKGDILCLLNNDIEVVTPDWLARMVSIVLQPGTGAVGAKLLYSNDTIQHGGVIMGLGGIAGHAHVKQPRSTGGYFARAALAQNVSAVTGACLVVMKDHYESVSGLNEDDLPVAFNDVDFCLRLMSNGLRNVWTPDAILYHHESATRGSDTTPEKQERFKNECSYMELTWSQIIRSDPAYNPNLKLGGSGFSLAFPPRAQKPWRKNNSEHGRAEP